MTAQLSFWARRRAAVQAEAAAERQAEEDAQLAAQHAELADKDDETILRDMGLPDPGAMQSGDDFAAFMAKEVPNHLRNRALRTLWRSNPVLACVDGLNEYDDDFRAAMLAGGPVETAYQVGKGMMAHIEAMAQEKEEAETALTDETVVEDDPVLPGESSGETTASEEGDEDRLEVAIASSGDARPRRMRFRFEEAEL